MGRISLLLGSLLVVATAAAAPASADPWRLDEALQTPEWFRVSGEQRTRYEGLANQFRPGLDRNAEAIALRTLVRLDLEMGPFAVVGEFEDSRAYLTDDKSGLSTIVVNAVALLQAYLNLRLEDTVMPGSLLDLRFGRQTIDLGGRRLVARNRFRNTIQNFNGLSADWQGENGSRLFTFFVLPVQILPSNSEIQALVDNEVVFDEEDFDYRFWGVFFSHPLAWEIAGEIYLFGLHEYDDPSELETRNRQLYTPGLRFVRPPRPGSWDLDVETTLQFGTRRASANPSDDRELQVFAQFQHATVGYMFDAPWRPRVSAELDYASGEYDTSDGTWTRFDTLFGPRRTEFGPTDIYGPLGRENIISAGLRVGARPSDRLDGYVSWRANFLDARRDFFARTGVRDRTGRSGSFAGHQVEFRTRFWVVPGSLILELGGAAFIQGRFMNTAPNATGFGDPLFIYSDFTFFF